MIGQNHNHTQLQVESMTNERGHCNELSVISVANTQVSVAKTKTCAVIRKNHKFQPILTFFSNTGILFIRYTTVSSSHSHVSIYSLSALSM